MKKTTLFLFLSCLLCLLNKYSFSQTVNTTTTAKWAFDLGTTGQVATFTNGADVYINSNFVNTGTKLPILDKNTTYNITFTRFQPTEQLGAASVDAMVSFHILPKAGLNFVPDSVSFDCLRYGTDGGLVDIIWKASDGTSTTLATGLKPARNNSGAATHAYYDLTALSIPASTGDCALEIYVYSLGNTKQVGFSNIRVAGKLQGTLVNLASYNLVTAVAPVAGGTIVTNPAGTKFDDGTEITLTTSKNFGYSFVQWENSKGDSLTNVNPYKITLTGDTTIKAVYKQLNTFSLVTNITGGAKDYMVTRSPKGTMVNTDLMYEEGTVVTITASNNPILTFTNWLTGETSSDYMVTMNKNQDVTAVYSAIDYIVGWDFYKSGNSGRVADFYSTTDNEASNLVLRKADGTATSWLDKSQVAAGGYEGKPAAVNWAPIADKYYYQISFNAKDFTDIKVKSAMMYNYNAYSIQNCEYSLNGTDFIQIGKFEMTAAKLWYDSTFTVPADANHADKVYIRWIPDYTSSVLGTTSTNDGTAISGIYVTGTETIFNDGIAPVLVSSVPTEAATGASASGKIVLTFDEKVAIVPGTTATLGSKVLTPIVSGKTITFNYTGLSFNTAYSFNLGGNVVSDLAGNTLTSAIAINFTTLSQPIVAKKSFDFVVGVDGDFKAAIAAAKTASSSGNRYYIFFPDGQYNIGANTGDANQMTTVSVPNVSYIGEHSDSVVVYNKSTQESINTTATMYFTNISSNIYMQDISLLNKMDYRTGTLVGRGVALWDQGSKNIYKNVKLLSNQDTYYSGSDRSYFESSEIHGTVDFICGGGDIFFNECLLYLEDRSGNVITAPATNSTWGYVFNNCTIDGFPSNAGGYRLGRPWSNAPKSVYLNTTMKVLPTATGWGDPMNVVPAVFAEYNSITENGTAVDLSSRRTTYTKDAVTVTLNPVLTAGQAAQYTLENVLGGGDAWLPNLSTEQATVPVISASGKNINWDNSDYVLCWAICKNGKFTGFVTTNSYTIPANTPDGTKFSVRAANAMGGLSGASNEVIYSITDGIKNLTKTPADILEKQYYTIDGRRLRSEVKGLVIIRTIYKDGSSSSKKVYINRIEE